MNLSRVCIATAIFAFFCYAVADGVTTTIYVGQHFEVRDHDQPTKYVFNSVTRVAEVTGSLSTNLRVQRLRLYSGWNLCSLAVSGTFPTSGAENIAAAYQWNPGTGSYSQLTLGQTLAARTILWLKAKTNAIVSALGTYNDPTLPQVQAGRGTYVPAAGLEAWLPAIPDSASAWDFDTSNAQWTDHLPGGLAVLSDLPFTVAPGQALYVAANTTVDLAIPDGTLRIRYYHGDHLGSSSVVTDANGALVEQTGFYPFGLPRNAYEPRHITDPYQFTGKEHDRESGLYYLGARSLAAGLGRFATVDPLGAELKQESLSNPQELNPYAYVRNNPVRLTDPLGLQATEKVLDFLTKWGKNAGPVGLAYKYIKLNAAGFHDLQDVSKAAKAGRELIRQVNDLERGARALSGVADEVYGAQATLPVYPLKTPEKGDPGGLVTAEELDYVRKYYNTARRIADEADAARRELDKAIAGWDAAVAQATKTDDFTRKAVWEEISDVDLRFSKQGGGFRAYLVNARDKAGRAADWGRLEQYHAADILGEWTPSWYHPPAP